MSGTAGPDVESAMELTPLSTYYSTVAVLQGCAEGLYAAHLFRPVRSPIDVAHTPTVPGSVRDSASRVLQMSTSE